MALEVVFKKAFVNDLEALVKWLDHEWGNAVTDRFLVRLWSKRHFSQIGIKSVKVKGVRSILITSKNRLYYRVLPGI